MPAMFACSASRDTASTGRLTPVTRRVVVEEHRHRRGVRHRAVVAHEHVGGHLRLEESGRPHQDRVGAERRGAPGRADGAARGFAAGADDEGAVLRHQLARGRRPRDRTRPRRETPPRRSIRGSRSRRAAIAATRSAPRAAWKDRPRPPDRTGSGSGVSTPESFMGSPIVQLRASSFELPASRALQNVVRTLRSAASGRPEGLHYICSRNAL